MAESDFPGLPSSSKVAERNALRQNYFGGAASSASRPHNSWMEGPVGAGGDGTLNEKEAGAGDEKEAAAGGGKKKSGRQKTVLYQF